MRSHLADYLERGRSLNLSPHTLRAIHYNVTSFLAWLAGQGINGPDQVRRKHLFGWIIHLQAHRTSRGLPLKPKSVNKKIECLRGFLVYLAGEGLIPETLPGALESVKEPKLLPTSVLTHDQVRTLLHAIGTDTATGYRDRTMLELLYSTGIRAGELLGLDVAHLNLKDATALVHGKGRKQRVVPIGRTALSYLETYLRGVRTYLLRDVTEQAVFLDIHGKRLAYPALRRLVARYAEQAGIPIRVTPHTFRRSCTTELLRSGANMYHVKELLGHESLDTLQHYARLTITDLRKTYKRCHAREREST